MLNQQLDVAQLAASFKARKRIQIPDILQPEAADVLHRCLSRQVPWSLRYMEGENATNLPAEKIAALSSRDRQDLRQRIHARALENFQFLFNNYMMIRAYKRKHDPELVLHRLVEFLNAPLYLDFIKAVTGIANIVKADAQATRYMPGHFLKQHNDHGPVEGREVAYVINLSKDWQPDWGGLLNFVDAKGDVIDTFMPRYNSLSLFRVPIEHCVSMVSPYALRARYSVSGWLMSGH